RLASAPDLRFACWAPGNPVRGFPPADFTGKRPIVRRSEIGNPPSAAASRPSAITVSPDTPQAAQTAASGFEAIATFTLSPYSDAWWIISRAIEGGCPNNRSQPARSTKTLSGDVSTTRGATPRQMRTTATGGDSGPTPPGPASAGPNFAGPDFAGP